MLERFLKIRERTTSLVGPLHAEDFVMQPMEDVSPPKWHLAHTTWFFEQFILKVYFSDYKEFHPDFGFLFNSYYQHLGERNRRDHRGFISRPGTEEIFRYRKYVDGQMSAFWPHALLHPQYEEILVRMELGLQHEQQHQELLLTDIKYILGSQPFFPVYDKSCKEDKVEVTGVSGFLSIPGGIYTIGYSGNDFCFDNELSAHQVLLGDFRISTQAVNNREYLEFINAGGYTDFRFWLSEGWEWIQQERVSSPLYWHLVDGIWHRYTLSGVEKINENEVLMHVSYFEADAFARWKGCRLPTEQEMEVAAGIFPGQMQSPVWEWTGSAYLAYPGFKTAEGALGEYNGKFMINQMVLRGSSLATPEGHWRPSYRNFFHAKARWQFNGIRLAC